MFTTHTPKQNRLLAARPAAERARLQSSHHHKTVEHSERVDPDFLTLWLDHNYAGMLSFMYVIGLLRCLIEEHGHLDELTESQLPLPKSR